MTAPSDPSVNDNFNGFGMIYFTVKNSDNVNVKQWMRCSAYPQFMARGYIVSAAPGCKFSYFYVILCTYKNQNDAYFWNRERLKRSSS